MVIGPSNWRFLQIIRAETKCHHLPVFVSGPNPHLTVCDKAAAVVQGTEGHRQKRSCPGKPACEEELPQQTCLLYNFLSPAVLTNQGWEN